ncbi:hypothetical protein SK128_015864 [Halocaridina rubra]|uniref:Clathrin light chain n=1 Tax=Halocaridina rubra TaxID=373956 RepID=A0AAN8WQU5_HALRR
MDGFGDSFVPTAENGTPAPEVDPAAEFLAREQDQLAGLDDDLVPAAPANGIPTEPSTEAELQDSASYPEPARSPVPTIPREEPEKIKIWREEQRVRLEHKDIAEEENKNELREKAKKELEEWYKQHEEQVAKTRQANRSAEKELVADTGKMEPGTEWERIAKLCDFNPKTAKSSRDISRMRSIILQVKQSPPVKA